MNVGVVASWVLYEDYDRKSYMALVLDSILCLFRLDSTSKGDGLIDLARTYFHLIILQNLL